MNRLVRGSLVSALRTGRREEGQALILAVLALLALIGALGIVIDVGRAHIVQRRLQIAADAAALAGATQLPSGAAATASALSYDGSAAGGGQATDGKNMSMSGITTTTVLGCLSAATLGSPITCTPNAPGGGRTAFSPACSSNCNAIRVTESAMVPPMFMQVLGFGSSRVSSTATATVTGGVRAPLDVEVIVDTTASMSTGDNCTITGIASPTQLDCAKQGVAALLGILEPCNPNLALCGSNVTTDNVANPVDRVGLMVFPALTGVSAGTGAGVPAETNCTSGEINGHVTYTINPTYFGNYSNYQVVPFSSDYRVSDTASSADPNNPGLALSTTSNLANAVYWKATCGGGNYPGNEDYGVEDPGGVGTYYGDVIAMAQSALNTYGRSSGGVKKAIILLSDGNATASAGNLANSMYDKSGTNECQAGITQAEAAAAAGTTVYTIAYGAPPSGCVDSASPPDYSAQSPDCSMVMMANNSVSNSSYANDAAALAAAQAAGCTSGAGAPTDTVHHYFNTPTGAALKAAFQSIGNSLTASRLVPDNAT